jgi:methionyl-tRNA formyltransferase
MNDNPKIIFAGTPDFSVPPLQALLDAGYPLSAVYTQPDRPAGRGRKLLASPVKQLAQKAGIPVYQPVNFNREDDLTGLESLEADLMVVVAYGLILPKRVLDAPRLGCINIHASLLPRWRGAAPIQRAILAGDAESGITIMEMEAGLDTGPMLLRRPCPIGSGETGSSLHDRLSQLGAEALMAALPGIVDGTLKPQPQDDSQATYAHKLEKREARLDWDCSARELDRQIRAFNPWPVAQTGLDGKILRIWESSLQPGVTTLLPGSVVAAGKEGIDVATGGGMLRIRRLQIPGKRAMSTADFLNAHDLTGAVFETQPR